MESAGGQHDRVERIFAFQHPGNRQALGQDGRHVLAAVHGQIDLPAQQRVLDFLHEQPFAADVRQRRFLKPIARRMDDLDPARRTAGCGNSAGDGVRLPERELTAARPEAKFSHGMKIWNLAFGIWNAIHDLRQCGRIPNPKFLIPNYEFDRRNGVTRRDSAGRGSADGASLRPNSRFNASE